MNPADFASHDMKLSRFEWNKRQSSNGLFEPWLSFDFGGRRKCQIQKKIYYT
jgi:hypothetical protein